MQRIKRIKVEKKQKNQVKTTYLLISSGIEIHPILERGKKKTLRPKENKKWIHMGRTQEENSGKEEVEEEQANGKITRTSENDHIGKVSASVRWQKSSSSRIPESAENCVWKPSPKSILLQLCGSGYLPFTWRALYYLHQQKPRKGKEIFSGVAESRKYFVFKSFTTQHLPFGFIKACKSAWYQVPEGVSGLLLRGPCMLTAQWGDIRYCKHWRNQGTQNCTRKLDLKTQLLYRI